MSAHKTATMVNGVNMDALGETVSAIKENPAMGECSFHVHNKWEKGGFNCTSVTDFLSAGKSTSHKQQFKLCADEPDLLGGTDQAPNPVEHLLNSLAACMTTSMICHAAVRGIEIEEMESEIEGDIDIRGFLGLSEDVRKGYKNITIKFKVKTDEENMNKLRSLAEFSPVFDTISEGTNIDIEIEKM